MAKLGIFGLLILFSCCTISESDPLVINSDIHNTVVKVDVYNSIQHLGSASAVLIDCTLKKSDIDGAYYEMLFLTAKHVVKTITQESGSARVSLLKDNKSVLFSEVTKTYECAYRDAGILVVKSLIYIKPAQLELIEPIPLDEVYAIGVPAGEHAMVTHGIVSYQAEKNTEGWTCDASVAEGNSGGGVFRKKTGHLWGISSMIGLSPVDFHKAYYIHWFVPINQIIGWIEEVRHERAS